jgi:hypothetical protein
MDRSLREMGVGDMGVGKRVKKMATVYYGRADAYARARSQGDDDLAAAILRNVYAGDEVRAGKKQARLAGMTSRFAKLFQTPGATRSATENSTCHHLHGLIPDKTRMTHHV